MTSCCQYAREMFLPGGNSWFRTAALLLAGACAVAGLSGCEYADDGAGPTSAPSGTSRPAPPSPLPAAADLANAENRNFKDLGTLLGARPGGDVLEGAGGLGGGGFNKSVKVLAQGTYTFAAACVGVPTAYFSITQDGVRDLGRRELTIDCGKASASQVDIAAWPVQVQVFHAATGPATGAAAGFWMVPASTGS